MERHIRDPHQKALAINLDKSVYGTVAEIGAGQETARWFFRVGGAAGTIAKSISAYDMKFSDAIYGPSPRYVSRDRLSAMLQHEFALVLDRLDAHRGEQSAFFAFANTVAARSYSRKVDGHGWLGIRFQHEPHAPASQIDVHVNLHGSSNLRDQETLGVLGVNLIYGAMHLHSDCESLLESLMDQLYPELVEIDMVDFSGPAFASVDNRVMALRLVQKGFSSAAMFTADGHIAQVADALWKRAVLVERSRFRPPTKLTMELLDRAQSTFLGETSLEADGLVVLSEMTLNNLTDGGDIDVEDFLNRADILCALGKNVLVSNYGEHYRLAQYLFRHTDRPISLVMGLPTLREVFDEKYYEHLPGGILESFGRLFKQDLRLYVCAERDSVSGESRGLQDLELPTHLHHLYAYLLERGCIKPLDEVSPAHLSIYSHEVLTQIRKGDAKWEEKVPPEVAQIIKQRGLFGLNSA